MLILVLDLDQARIRQGRPGFPRAVQRCRCIVNTLQHQQLPGLLHFGDRWFHPGCAGPVDAGVVGICLLGKGRTVRKIPGQRGPVPIRAHRHARAGVVAPHDSIR
ncbi:hypothetical protein D3C86_1895120 [compost metagenome]